jgi:hypothetical protein
MTNGIRVREREKFLVSAVETKKVKRPCLFKKSRRKIMLTFEQNQNLLQKSVNPNAARSYTATSGLNHRADFIIQLQRTIGNQTVQRPLEGNTGNVERVLNTMGPGRLGHDFARIPVYSPTPMAAQFQPSFGKGDQASGRVPEPEKEPPRLIEPIGAVTPSVSGTVPDIKTPEGEGRVTGEEELAADLYTPGGTGNVVADIQLNFSQPRTDRLRVSKNDPAVSGVSIGSFRQPGGRAVGQFGAEFYEPAFTGIKYAFASGKCTITGALDVVCPWGTNAGGCTDVPSASDAVVTKAEWPSIKADLEPGAASPFKSRRTKYYSQSLVERHEKFHGTDDNGWSAASGLGIVKTHLEAATVVPASAAADVPALVDGARVKLISENLKWYKGGGAAHDAYAGEIRAYADGKDTYKKLADDVEKHGKSLP